MGGICRKDIPLLICYFSNMHVCLRSVSTVCVHETNDQLQLCGKGTVSATRSVNFHIWRPKFKLITPIFSYSLEGISITEFVIVYVILIFAFFNFCSFCLAADITFICLMLHLVANYRVLKAMVKQMDEDQSDEAIKEKIKAFVDHQNAVYDLINLVQEVSSVSLLILYCTIGCTMCLIAVDISMNKSGSNFLKESFFATAIFMQLLSSTLLGSILLKEVNFIHFIF